MSGPWLGTYGRGVIRAVMLHVTVALAAGTLLFSVVDFVEVSNLAADTVTSLDLLQLSVMNAPSIVRVLLPLAVPIGCSTAIGSLVRRRELAAFFSAGASPLAVLKPVFLCGALWASVHALNVELLIPGTRAKVAETRERLGLSRQSSQLLGGSQTWFKGSDRLYRARSVLDAEGKVLGNVLILDVDAGHLRERIDVDRLSHRDGQWVADKVVARSLELPAPRTERAKTKTLPLSEQPSDFIRGIAPPQRLPYRSLARTTEARARLGQPTNAHLVELYRRRSTPLTIWCLAVIGAALAIRLGRRQSFASALFAGVTVGFSAWLLRETARLLGTSHALMPAVAAHLPLLAFALLMAVTLARAQGRGLQERRRFGFF